MGQNTSFTNTPGLVGPTSNNWIGRSPVNGLFFRGNILEFRVYQGALSPLEVAQSDAAGPDQPQAFQVTCRMSGWFSGNLRSGRVAATRHFRRLFQLDQREHRQSAGSVLVLRQHQCPACHQPAEDSDRGIGIGPYHGFLPGILQYGDRYRRDSTWICAGASVPALASPTLNGSSMTLSGVLTAAFSTGPLLGDTPPLVAVGNYEEVQWLFLQALSHRKAKSPSKLG